MARVLALLSFFCALGGVRCQEPGRDLPVNFRSNRKINEILSKQEKLRKILSLCSGFLRGQHSSHHGEVLQMYRGQGGIFVTRSVISQYPGHQAEWTNQKQ